MKTLKYKIVGAVVAFLGGSILFASAQIIPFTSKQVAPNPSTGNCLSTNGSKNSWSSSCGGVGTSTNPFMATYFVATGTSQTSNFNGNVSIGAGKTLTVDNIIPNGTTNLKLGLDTTIEPTTGKISIGLPADPLYGAKLVIYGDSLGNSGTVGINNPTPGANLGVNGTFAVGFNYSSLAPPANSGTIEGRFGVGTSSPYAKLSVNNVGTFPSFLVEDSTNPDSTPFIIDDSGNVGIGTTTPGTLLSIGNTGTNAINISPTATSTFGTGLNLLTGCFAINNACVHSGTLGVSQGGTGQTSFGQGWLGINDSGAFVSSTSPTVNYITATSTTATSTFSTAGFTIGATRLVVQQGSGNIGIGTAVPLGILTITDTSNISMGKMSDATSFFAMSPGNVSPASTNYAFAVDTTSGSTLVNSPTGTVNLRIGNATKLIVKGSNVGIGTTSPFAKLSITGATTEIPFVISTTTVTTASTTLFMIDKAGDVHYGGGTPTLSSCGTAPSFDANSTDQSGTVTFGATASGCTITFSVVKASSPHCIVTAQSLSLTNALTYTETATALTLTEASSGGLKFDYFCSLGH